VVQGIPPERLPHILYLYQFLTEAQDITIVDRKGSIKMIKIIRAVKRRNPKLYQQALRAYNCHSDTCLARSMSQMLYRVLKLKSFGPQPKKAGDIVDISEWPDWHVWGPER